MSPMTPVSSTGKVLPRQSVGTGGPEGKPASLPPSDRYELMTRAVLALPALVHHSVQSTLPKTSDPFGGGTMAAPDWIDPKDKQLLDQSARIDDKLSLALQIAYSVIWFVLLLIYFAG